MGEKEEKIPARLHAGVLIRKNGGEICQKLAERDGDAPKCHRLWLLRGVRALSRARDRDVVTVTPTLMHFWGAQVVFFGYKPTRIAGHPQLGVVLGPNLGKMVQNCDFSSVTRTGMGQFGVCGMPKFADLGQNMLEATGVAADWT